MKTKEEILKPFVEIPFRHTKIVDYDNALKAMDLYHNQKLGYEIRIGNHYNYYDTETSIPIPCEITNIIHDGHYVVYEFINKEFTGRGATIYPDKLKPKK